jgi:hypothetical protein
MSEDFVLGDIQSIYLYQAILSFPWIFFITGILHNHQFTYADHHEAPHVMRGKMFWSQKRPINISHRQVMSL